MKLYSITTGIMLIGLFILQCGADELTYEHQGVITGLDYRKCACQTPTCGCCGAFIVEINKEAYYFFTLPKESDIILEPQHFTHIPVKLNFIFDPESCGPAGRYILITDIIQL
ncbi:MAG: hypothetical protein SH818_12950 [Saprospiraceae bacterium]|nr:hypothetical protein [Saprospiraceae bacterium]